jgi:16S rRNA (cytosine1402-N4)-methyltransferase
MSPADFAGSHTPVLYQAVLSALQPRAGSRYVDGTLGAGGHAGGVLELASPDGLLLGLDRDPAALDLASARLERFGTRLTLRHGSFADLGQHLAAVGWPSVQGVLLDLGLSSMQLEAPDRGFAFRLDGPLDMRFDPGQPSTADDLVNQLTERELADLLWRWGEEPQSRRIARAIVAQRPLDSTLELASVVARAAGHRPGQRIHPATRTFQALRIAVNDELAALEAGLEQAVGVLAPGGRLAVISFHSLEDRIVKHFLRAEAKGCICPPQQPVCTCGRQARLRVVTPRPIRPDADEMEVNPRARSARLRVGERRGLA